MSVLLDYSIASDKHLHQQLIDVMKSTTPQQFHMKVLLDKVERYKIISGREVENNIYKISELVEKPPKEKTPSNLAIMGRYVLTPDIFEKIDEHESYFGGEIQLTYIQTTLHFS